MCTSRSRIASPDAAMPPYIHVRKQDAGVNFAVEFTRTSGDSTQFFTWPPETMQPCETSESSASPVRPAFGKHKLCRRILPLVGADRPLFVVQVEDRRHRHQVHVGFVKCLQCSYVAPVERFFLILIDEVVRRRRDTRPASSAGCLFRNRGWTAGPQHLSAERESKHPC